MAERKYRMYGLVPNNISSIQKGIQFGHAVVEYGITQRYSEYLRWAAIDKKFIILNGGTTNKNLDRLGTLNNHLETLIKAGVRVEWFEEPDLGDQLTAIVFLVDDRVWDRENFPDYVTDDGYLLESDLNGDVSESDPYEEWKSKISDSKEEQETIIFLREFLSPKNFKLA